MKDFERCCADIRAMVDRWVANDVEEASAIAAMLSLLGHRAACQPDPDLVAKEMCNVLKEVCEAHVEEERRDVEALKAVD